MNAIAEKVTPIDEGKEVVLFSKALTKFDIQEQVIGDLEEATKLEITDTASEKIVRKHRQNAKALEVKIEKERLRLNREYKEQTDSAAALIGPRITAVYTKLDEKVKTAEAVREEKKAAAVLVEKLRLGKIQWHMDGLEYDCAAGLEYNLPADEIQMHLTVLLDTEISAVDYEERTEEAEIKLSTAIAATEAALENRIEFETEQARQEAEAKRLADLEADRKAQEEADRKAREAEAEIQRQEAEALKAEREALEKEKAEMAHNAIVVEREAVWEIAHQEDFEFDHIRALAEHEIFLVEYWTEIDILKRDAKARWEATEKAKAEKLEREKLIGPDRMMITTIANDLDKLFSNYGTPILNTEEGNTLVRDLIAGVKTEIHIFEQKGAALA